MRISASPALTFRAAKAPTRSSRIRAVSAPAATRYYSRELVASDTEGPVRSLRGPEQEVRCPAERFVPGRMAEGVVDGLEMVKIQDEERRARGGRSGDLPRQGFPQGRPVSQARETVPEAGWSARQRRPGLQYGQARPGLLREEIQYAYVENARRAGGGHGR